MVSQFNILRVTSCGFSIRTPNLTPKPYIESNANWFFLVKSGKLNYSDDNVTVQMSPNNFYILPARKFFSLTDIKGSSFKHLYISFDLTHPITSFEAFDVDNDPFLKDIFNIITKHFKTLNEETLKSLISSILTHTSLKINENFGLAHSIREYIDSCLPLFSIEDVCSKFCYNKHHLNNKFKESYGMTIRQYAKNEQFSYVANELKNGRAITDISNAINYSSPANLSRDFYKHYGKTATEYKNSKTIK